MHRTSSKRRSPRRLPGLFAAVAAFSLLAAAAPAAGQEVRGRVIERSFGDVLESAAVELLDANGERVRWTLSDEDGRYSLRLEPGVTYRLRAARLGFFDYETEPFSLAPGETREVDLLLGINPVQLEQLLVEQRGSRVSPGRELVQRHQLLGKGVFLSGTVLALEDHSYTLDAFRDVEGLLVNGQNIVPMRGPYRCLKFLQNNLPLKHEAGYNAIPPQDIAAVEIYREFAEVPPDLRFEALDHDARTGSVRHCGLINMWTKGAW